jgi:acetyltransferase
MDFFFKPKGVALIGASANPLKGGYHILKNLMLSYKDNFYPVNPGYQEIEGLKCYSSVLEVPDPVEMAIVFVPAAFVPRVVRECAQRGIKGVMIQSAGFGEIGETGEALQQEIVQICDETGIRLWGPNCMGMVDAVHERVFSF